MEVFEYSGCFVFVFNDKYLSINWDECKEMVEDFKWLDFVFLVGLLLLVIWCLL